MKSSIKPSPFQVNATDELLSMLDKAVQAENMTPNDRVQISILKFLVYRARGHAKHAHALPDDATNARVGSDAFSTRR